MLAIIQALFIVLINHETYLLDGHSATVVVLKENKHASRRHQS